MWTLTVFDETNRFLYIERVHQDFLAFNYQAILQEHGDFVTVRFAKDE